MSSEQPRLLLWADMIFCDAETDPEIIKSYLSRFSRTLASIGEQSPLSDGTDMQIVIHVSRDKSAYLPALERSISRMGSLIGAMTRIHLYDHPNGGYDAPPTSHVDKLKNPNKQPGRRESLFASASEYLHLDQYDALIRVSMDDDDLLHPAHFEQINLIARGVLRETPQSVSAVGMYRQFLAYVRPEGVTLENVAFRRCIPGNKFFVIPRAYYDTLETYSPWGIPEFIDQEAADLFSQRGILLTLVRNNEPTFLYMRRGSNLSQDNKSAYIDNLEGRRQFKNEDELHDFISSQSNDVTYSPDLAPLAREFRLTVSRSPDGRAVVSANLEKMFGPDAMIAYYLVKGAERLKTLWYSREEVVVFKDVPPGCSVRAFVRLGDEIIHRKAVRIWG